MGKHYRLAVGGKQNSTVIGRSYRTIREALDDVNRVNEERTREGLKPVTSLKIKTGSGGYRHFQYVGRYDEDEPPNALREPLKVIHGALTEAIAEKDKELFDRMKNQIQTAITMRDRATQVALNFVGHSISSSDGSYEILIQNVHDALIEQAHVSAKAESDECLKILQKAYQEWFDGDHSPQEAFDAARDRIQARANPTFKGAEIIFDEPEKLNEVE